MVSDEIYLFNLVIAISSRFREIAQSYENSAHVFEDEIKGLCFLESEKIRVFYDKRNVINNAVLLRKKASLYRLIADILTNSMNLLIANKKKIDKDKKKLEEVVNGKMNYEEAVDLILAILKSILNINIDKNRYYEVGEYEVRKHFETICS